eukprot:3245109-Pyramimonas_sp.AAC.1
MGSRKEGSLDTSRPHASLSARRSASVHSERTLGALVGAIRGCNNVIYASVTPAAAASATPATPAAVSATPAAVSATPAAVSATPAAVSATPAAVSATPAA